MNEDLRFWSHFDENISMNIGRALPPTSRFVAPELDPNYRSLKSLRQPRPEKVWPCEQNSCSVCA